MAINLEKIYIAGILCYRLRKYQSGILPGQGKVILYIKLMCVKMVHYFGTLIGSDIRFNRQTQSNLRSKILILTQGTLEFIEVFKTIILK